MYITTEVQDAVEVITIDRPKALNALNPEVLDELKAAFEAVDQNVIRCIILTGAGDKSFVAGADIASMSTMTKGTGEKVFCLSAVTDVMGLAHCGQNFAPSITTYPHLLHFLAMAFPLDPLLQ